MDLVGWIRKFLQSGASGLRLGWVELDLGNSPGWWAASVATYCPSRMVEHPKSNSTQPSRSPDAPDCTCNAQCPIHILPFLYQVV